MFTGTFCLLFAIGSILLAENIRYSVNVGDDDTTIAAANQGIYNTNVKPQASESYFNKCPEGMIYFQHPLGIPFCYILTEKRQFFSSCPYQNSLEDDTITLIYDLYKNISIWAKAIRNTDDGFGQFEWLDISTRYLDVISQYERPQGSVLDKKCLIRFNNTLIPVSCDEEYPRLCIYSYYYRVINKFCSKRNNFSNCISATLNMDNKCFCQVIVKGNRTSRSVFCDKLAEPVTKFQSHVLLSQLTHKAPCWFGAEKKENHQFQWSSSKQLVSYEYWKKETNFSKSYAAFDYVRPHGWLLMDDNTLSCGICEVEVAPQNVTLFLKHNLQRNTIEVRINNLFDMHHYFLFQYVLVCFTDLYSTNLKMRVVSGISDVIVKDSPYYVKHITIKNYYPSYYWCETIQRPNAKRVFSNKILVYKNTGKHRHEYSLTVEMYVPRGTDPYLHNLHISYSEIIRTKLNSSGIINIVRPIKILSLSEINQNMTLLLHISTTLGLESPMEEYLQLYKALQALQIEQNNLILNILSFSRAEVCLESITHSGNFTLHWQETGIGITVLPKELCLMEDSMPVTRKCEGDFLHGGKWSAVKGDCSNKQLSNTTVKLYYLLYVEKDCNKITKSLFDLTQNEDMLMVEIHFIAEILRKLKNSKSINITEIVEIYSNIMRFDGDTINLAQQELNSTDIILEALDTILNNVKAESTIKSGQLMVQITDLRNSNITGFAGFKSNQSIANNDNFDIYEFRPLYNSSTEELVEDEVDIAFYLSKEQIEEIFQCVSFKNDQPIKLIISLFYNGTLFNEIRDSPKKESGIVISVSLPGFVCEFKQSFPIIFKSLRKFENTYCGIWEYGMNEMKENIYGSWKLDGVLNNVRHEISYFVCEHYHTTHFALLMWKEKTINMISPKQTLILNILTLIGCVLSLLGLFCVFITAIIFKNWRKRSHNIIMLNFSAALATQIILLFVADHASANTVLCFISAASLHYMVLAEFAWMLVIAILQYRKFVLVFYKPVQHLTLKCLIIGWVLPSIPIFIYLIYFPESYKNSSNGICYLQNEYFYYGVAAPVFVITLINLFVFVKILVSVCCKKIDSYGSQTNEIRLQVLLAILLFFLLGLSWLFGICATITNYLIFSYIFCITATLQGFVIFLFFIVMNENSRTFWVNTKKILCCSKIRSERL